MDGRTLTILLRLIHILAGIFWAGAAFMVAGLLVPTARSLGRDGGRFMEHLTERRRMPAFFGIAMLLTVLSGFWLYARNAAASGGAWPSSAPGIGYGVGALAAILGGLVGMLLAGRLARRMTVVGQQAAAAGGLSAEQQAEMARLQARIAMATWVAAALLAVAAGAMAIARYL